MKVTIKSYNAVAYWKWDTSTEPHKIHHHASTSTDDDDDDDNVDGSYTAGYDPYANDEDEDDDDDDDDVCGICQAAYESTCPECKIPGDDCPLIWGECTHIFHMHCLLKWIDTESSKQQCPMDRRPWVTADRKPDKLPTTTTGEPVAAVVPGPLPIEPEDRLQDREAEDEDGFGSDRSGEADIGEEMQVDH